MDVKAESRLAMLKEQYQCPYFRILVVGRANAGKTTILEKFCGVAQGTEPIIYDEHGVELVPDETHLIPSIEVSCLHMVLHPLISNQFQKGLHDIEHQITYPGSNFIFHDSVGFESGSNKEMEIVWKFIEKRAATTELRDQLHAIWYFCWFFTLLDDHIFPRYCLPMDSTRPILPAELEFFNKRTGKGKFNHPFFDPCALHH